MCILVVDDDALMAEIVSRTLRTSRYEVDAVLSAEAALRWLQRRTPRLIVLDARMPGMDGFALLKRLKGEPRHLAVPVIMLTGSRSETDVLRARELGAASYLVKPLDPQMLLRRVQMCFETPLASPNGTGNGVADGEVPNTGARWLI